MNIMQKAKARLLLNHPFFATLVMQTPIRENKDIPTACTDMKSIEYNPDFFNSLPVEEVEFVLAHEVLHIVWLHGMRKHERQMPLWNWACDYAINYILKQSGMKMPKDGLYDEAYKGMSAEQIYDLLKREQEKNPPKGGQGQPGKPGSGSPPPVFGEDLVDPAPMSEAEQAKLGEEMKGRIAQAASMARLAGKMPGEIARMVGDILNPQVPWQDLLRDYMTRTTKNDETWAKRNRRFSSVYLPARHSEQMGEIVVIGDTSGSITAEDLNKTAAEINSIAQMVNPERIRVLWADTRVAKEEVHEAGDPITFDPKGGGGTDMRVPLAYAEQYHPDVVVLITDGYTPWPDSEPDYPLIVCCTTNANVPVGMVVRI